MRLSVVAFLLLFLAGCSSQQAKTFAIQNEQVVQVWPQPPETPRFRYLGELHGEGFNPKLHEPSWLEIIVGLIVGKPQPQLLKRPYSVYANDSTIYVADVGLSGVMVFDRKLSTVELWKHANEHINFKAPTAIAVVGEQVWVCDVDHGTIYRFDGKGNPLGEFGSGLLKRPIGMRYDDINQKLYVSDSAEHKVFVFDNAGMHLDTIGSHGEGDGQFNFPSFVEVKSEKLYVTDTMNARVQAFSLSDLNGVPMEFGKRGMRIGDTPRPKGIAVDSDENIYVVESYYGYLLVFNKNAQFLLPISGQGSIIGRYYLPTGVFIDNHDVIYLADTFNGRVVMLQYLNGRENVLSPAKENNQTNTTK